MIAGIALAVAVAVAAPTTTVVSLSCGGDLRIASQRWTGRDQPLAPHWQKLERRAGRQWRVVPLERANAVDMGGYMVRDRYVISWACVRSTGGSRYVALDYACAIDPGLPGDCGGTKQWSRLLRPDGRYVDEGLPHDGVQRDDLLRRLGLAGVFAAGVTMSPIVE